MDDKEKEGEREMKAMIIVCLGCLVSISGHSVRTPLVAQYFESANDDPSYQGWAGPGWYYGQWFDTESEYEHWLQNRFYDVQWTGPNWYYGVWFDEEAGFNEYRWNHHYYDREHRHGDGEQHREQHRGEWKGRGHGGDQHGRGRGGGGHGGGHGR